MGETVLTREVRVTPQSLFCTSASSLNRKHPKLLLLLVKPFLHQWGYPLLLIPQSKTKQSLSFADHMIKVSKTPEKLQFDEKHPSRLQSPSSAIPMACSQEEIHSCTSAVLAAPRQAGWVQSGHPSTRRELAKTTWGLSGTKPQAFSPRHALLRTRRLQDKHYSEQRLQASVVSSSSQK